MDFGLAGKVAVVAGGSRGCGLAIARELAREGASVVLTGRNRDIVEAAAEAIRADGGAAYGLTTEMVSAEDAARIAQAARDKFGDPGILVVNPPTPGNAAGFFEVTDEDYLRAHEYFNMPLVRLSREMIPA